MESEAVFAWSTLHSRPYRYGGRAATDLHDRVELHKPRGPREASSSVAPEGWGHMPLWAGRFFALIVMAEDVDF